MKFLSRTEELERYSQQFTGMKMFSMICSWDKKKIGSAQYEMFNFFRLVNEGDEVIIVEPFYDNYQTVIKVAGGIPRYIPLRLVNIEIVIFPDLTIRIGFIEFFFIREMPRMILLAQGTMY